MSDVRGFCERQPDACEAGGKVAVALGHKAEAGARTLYEFISRLREKSASPEKADAKADSKAIPASLAGKNNSSNSGNGASGNASHFGASGTSSVSGTLTPTDLAPAWHAPVPLPPRRDARANPAA